MWWSDEMIRFPVDHPTTWMSEEIIRTSADHMITWQAGEIISKYPLTRYKK
jgi:hypothetical protein